MNSKSTIADGKKLVKGVGYMTICFSDRKIYELSAQRTMLRKTVFSDGVRKEFLYERVEGRAEIDNIEFTSERWEQYGVGNSCGYIVLEQCTAAGKRTGYIKVVPKTRANVKGIVNIRVDARRKDCIYYKRRTAK